MHARMTLMGIEMALNHDEKSIMDACSITNDNFNKDDLLAAIISKGATFEALYADPDYFYLSVGYFWNRWSRTFTEWFNAFDIEYNPLDNYDRHEQIVDTTSDEGSGSNSESTTSTHDANNSGTLSNTTNEDSESHVENKVSAFDGNDYVPHDKSDTTGGVDTTIAQMTGDVIDEESTNNVMGSSTTKFDREFDHTAHIWGNIGVVTSSKMLEEYIKTRSINLYNKCADVFCNEMTLRVY